MKKSTILSFLISAPFAAMGLLAALVTILATAQVINPDLSLGSIFELKHSQVEPEVTLPTVNDIKVEVQ